MSEDMTHHPSWRADSTYCTCCNKCIWQLPPREASTPAFECVLTVLLVIKFIDPSASRARIYLSESKTKQRGCRARYVAKYSLIFCGYLISQEWTWLIKPIRLQLANINHVPPSSRYQPWGGRMCALQICAYASASEREICGFILWWQPFYRVRVSASMCVCVSMLAHTASVH